MNDPKGLPNRVLSLLSSGTVVMQSRKLRKARFQCMADANNASGKLSLLSIITFSVATFPVSALAVALFVYLPPYLAGHLGVPLATIGLVWATVRIVDLFVDPVLGHAMDRTQTRFGRYRAWLASGVPILMLAVYKLFMAPKGVGGSYVLLWLFVLYIGNSILIL